MKQAVLFDLIGTLLVARTKRPLSMLYTILADHGLKSSVEAFTTAWEADASIPSQNHHTPFEERIARVINKLKWNTDWGHIERIADDICNEAAKVLSVDDETYDLFERLHGHLEFGLVTNYDHPPAIYKLLEDTHLDDYFSVIIISGEIGIWKPDPKILYAAIETLSVKPSHCIYVGDSSVDIEVAISAGVDPILIDRDNGLADPFRDREYSITSQFRSLIDNHKLHVIRRLSEIEKYI
jgi:HAD superfamily hydrolase (TIGR01549 family)